MSIIKSPRATFRSRRQLQSLQQQSLQQQKGFSMLEVLITVVISAVGLIGLAGLQISSVNATTKASANTQTMIAMKEMVGQLLANRDFAKAGDFNISAMDSAGTLQAFSTGLEPSEPNLAQSITYRWFDNLNKTIPGVKAGIYCDGMGMCAIRVQLSESVENMEQTISVQL